MTDFEVTRRTSTPDYDAFQRLVYASTRVDEMAIVPWSEQEKAAFLDMQFRAQDTFYRREFPNSEFDVLLQNGEPIGRLYTNLTPTALHVLDIALLPEYRGNGLGTRLIKDLMEQARSAGLKMTLHVEIFNPARRLYNRLGFTEKQVDGIYLLMTWNSQK
jgi:ribosomal protein S18 acetylase RimI-like enzyme